MRYKGEAFVKWFSEVLSVDSKTYFDLMIVHRCLLKDHFNLVMLIASRDKLIPCLSRCSLMKDAKGNLYDGPASLLINEHDGNAHGHCLSMEATA